MKKFDVGQVVHCPQKVAESGYLKIFGYDESQLNPLLGKKKSGNYLVREFLPDQNCCVSSEPWYVSEKELNEWHSANN